MFKHFVNIQMVKNYDETSVSDPTLNGSALFWAQDPHLKKKRLDPDLGGGEYWIRQV